jgi:DNA-binding transcriptional LysR family regulator
MDRITVIADHYESASMTTYDPEQLRTFLAVAQSLSFTQAAVRLGIRQPTVSQHVRKLEQAVGRPLFVRDTRTVTLTADGEAMAGFARTILAAHDQAAAHFTGSGLRGRLRFGVTDDLALTPLPRILREFRQLYPRIDLDLTVAQSPNLLRRLESGHLDLAYVKHNAGGGYEPHGRLVRRDPMVWAAAAGTRLDPGVPVPLVAYRAPSLSRSLGVQTLDEAGRASRITCIVTGVNGVLAAVRAGLGLGIFARSLMPSDLVEPAGLPPLPDVDLVLMSNPRAPSEPAEALTSAILGTAAPLQSR